MIFLRAIQPEEVKEDHYRHCCVEVAKMSPVLND